MKTFRVAALSLVFALSLQPFASAAPVTLPAVLTGNAERPNPVTSTGGGRAVITVNDARTQITVELQVAGLSSITASHIHVGSPDVAGPIILPLAAPVTGSLVKTLTATDLTPAGGINTFADAVANIQRENTYANVHTTANPGGEIRGQIAGSRPAFVSPGGPTQLRRGQTLALTWTPVPGAASYGLVVSRPNGFFNRPNAACSGQQLTLCELDLAQTILILPSTTTGTITLPADFPLGRYEVRVIGLNAAATDTVGVFSDVIPITLR